MKKCFLLITIFLITFGFFINSNVIYKQNNNTSKTNELNANTIPTNQYSSKITTNSLETYPSTNEATICYTINNASAEIDEVRWAFYDEKGYSYKFSFIEKTNDPIEEWGFTYTGEIKATDLSPGTTYQTYLMANDKNGSYYESDYIYVTVPKISKEGEVEQKDNTNVVVIDNDATLEYTISPAEIDNQVIVPKTITWFNGTEELVSDNINWVEETYDYSLTAKDIPIGEYNDTKLVVTDEKNIEYESTIPIDFEIKDIPKESTIKGTSDPKVEGQKSASINYEVILKPNDEIERISWKDKKTNEEIAFIDSTIENPIPLTGKLEANNLTPGTTYNTYLELKIKNDDNLYQDNEINSFTTKPGTTVGTVSSTVVATKKTATVDYTITPAHDEHGIEIPPKKITWSGEEENGDSFSTTEEVKKNDDGYTGSIKQKKLTPGTNYINNKLVVDDGINNYESTSSFEFTTVSGKTKGTVVANSNSITTTNTTATISYNIIPEKNNQGKYINPEIIIWVDKDGNELGGNASKENPGTSGLLTANNLTPDKDYVGTYLIVEDQEGNIKYTSLDPIREDGNPNDPIETFHTETNENDGSVSSKKARATGITTAKVEYNIIPTSDEYGTPSNPKKITWVNSEGNELGGEGNSSLKDPKTNGILEATNLIPEENYIGTYLIVEDYDGNIYKSIDPSEGSDEPNPPINTFTTKSNAKEGEINSKQEILIESEDSISVDFEITPALNKYGDKNKITKITWVDEQGNELGGEGNASLVGDEIPSIIDGKISGRITANSLESKNYYNTSLIVIDYNNGEYEPLKINDFSTRGKNISGEVSNDTEPYVGEDLTTATIDYSIIEATDENGFPITSTKIIWVDSEGNELGGKGSSSKLNPGTSGTLTATNLIPETNYDDTYLIVKDNNEEYVSIDPIDNFTTGNKNQIFKTKKMIYSFGVLISTLILTIIVIFIIIKKQINKTTN